MIIPLLTFHEILLLCNSSITSISITWIRVQVEMWKGKIALLNVAINGLKFDVTNKSGNCV